MKLLSAAHRVSLGLCHDYKTFNSHLEGKTGEVAKSVEAQEGLLRAVAGLLYPQSGHELQLIA